MLKIIPESHLDHGLTDGQVAHILERFSGATGFQIVTLELPEELGVVPCNLHGPAVSEPPVTEEEAFYGRRGTRVYESRLCRRPFGFSREVTVIMGPHGDEPCVLYTAFGGPCSPQEPAELEAMWRRLESEGKVEEAADVQKKWVQSTLFWAEHALGA